MHTKSDERSSPDMKNLVEYIEKKKNLQENIIYFIDNETSDADKDSIDFKNIIQILNNEQIRKDRQEMKSFLYMITTLSKHHHRYANFITKIENLLFEFKKEIRNFFTDDEIFRIFQSNKRILLFLIEQKILIINQSIADVMVKKYTKFNYKIYFYPEIKKFLKDEEIQSIELNENSFNENRKIGENENHICKLIRNDQIDEFISYVNSTNCQLQSLIKPSIFETNSILNKNEPSLIEYSAFYGSIQIFKYLLLNKVEINRSLFIYSIHGRNAEIIHLLEENLNEDSKRRRNVIESIKCYHSDLTDYFINVINQNNIDFSLDGIKFHNYFYFPNVLECKFTFSDDFHSQCIFYCFCKYDYFKIVDLIISESGINTNFIIIHT